MKHICITKSISFIFIILIFFACSGSSKSQKAPGLVNGILSKCPESPNCICTEYSKNIKHYTTPIDINNKNSLLKMKKILEDMGGEIVIIKENYISSIFKSSLFGFIDDIEIRIDKHENKIHLRSASRTGYSDMGVNLNRVKAIKERFKDK